MDIIRYYLLPNFIETLLSEIKLHRYIQVYERFTHFSTETYIFDNKGWFENYYKKRKISVISRVGIYGL